MSLSLTKQQVKSVASEFAIKPGHEAEIIVDFLSNLSGSGVNLRVINAFKSECHDSLKDIDVDPKDYTLETAFKFRDDYQAVKFLSKYHGLKTTVNKKERAILKFHNMEDHCRETNRRFKSYSELESSEYAVWLFAMRRKIDLILGEFSIEEMYDRCAWGPGVTSFIKGEDTSHTRKFQSEIGISHSAYDLFGSSLGAAFPLWFREEHVSDSSLQFVDVNRVTTVDKNAFIDRVIEIGPGICLWLQRGAGKYIGDRLKLFGFDLTDQTRNQELARLGSINGRVATVDHESASDSIAWAMVHKQFPVTWFTVLNALRVKSGEIDGVTYNWEKFSSMGNGFTFELESLIFAAAALVACEMTGCSTNDVSVFGDDVIIPTEAYDAYVKFSGFLGFKINQSKSYSTGHFRESCGAHWFGGLDVKPIFLKKVLSDAQSLYRLANSVRRYSHRCNSYRSCDNRFLGTWRLITRRLPSALRCLKIPDGYGDVGLISNFDEATPPLAPHGWECYSVLSLQERTVSKTQECHGLLVARVHGIAGPGISSDTRLKNLSGIMPDSLVREMLRQHSLKLQDVKYGNETDLRDRTYIAVKQMYVHAWYDLGPWV